MIKPTKRHLPRVAAIQRNFAGIQIEVSENKTGIRCSNPFKVRLFAHGDQPVGRGDGPTLAEADTNAAWEFYKFLRLADRSLELKA